MQNNVETKGKSTVYNIRFANLTDLHDYLKSDPVVNRRVFARQASVKNDFEFSGEDLDTSIGYCIGGYRKGFDNFLMSNTKLKETTHDLIDNIEKEISDTMFTRGEDYSTLHINPIEIL